MERWPLLLAPLQDLASPLLKRLHKREQISFLVRDVKSDYRKPENLLNKLDDVLLPSEPMSRNLKNVMRL